jgi:hypothetical protein
MKTILETLKTLAILFIAIAGLQAQAPQKIDYQAIAREMDGQPIAENNITVRISIIRGPLPGTMEFQEVHAIQTDKFGLFSLGIGTGTITLGSFSGIDWSSEYHFVQIEIDESNSGSFVDMGTLELMSVPYALYAERSGTSEKPDHEWADTYLRFEKPDGSWGSYVDLQGEQGPEGPAGQDGTGVNIIGSVPSAAHLDPFYSGAVGDMFIAENTGAGHVWNGTDWVEVGQIQGPEGPQGEQGPEGPKGDPGTTSWNGLTDIPTGFADNTDNVNDADANPSNEKINSVTLNASNILSISEPGNTKTVDLSSLAGGGALWTQNGANIYYNSGKVGIGTTNPSQKLEVKNGIIKSSGSLSSGFYAQGNANEGFWSYDNPGHGFRAHMNDGYGIFSDGNDDGAAYFDGDVHIVSDSKVGIGTNTPEAKLAVGGDGDHRDGVHGETAENNGAGIYGRGTGSDGYGGYFYSTSGKGIYVSGSTYDIYASSNKNYFGGKIGIKVAEPNENLEIGGDGRAFFGNGAGPNRKGLLIDGIQGSNAARIEAFDYANGGMNLAINNVGGGLVGIGTSSPTAKLSVNGTANKPGGGSWAVFSDARSKENVLKYTRGLEELMQLKPVSFTYKEEFGFGAETYVGLIAQEVEKVAPEMVKEVEVGHLTDFKELDPNELTYMLINAVKSLNEKVEKLESEIAELKSSGN